MSQLEQSPQARALSALRYISDMTASHHKKYVDPDSITAWNGNLSRKSPVKQQKITIKFQNQKLPQLCTNIRTNIRSNTNVTMISSIKNHRKSNNSRSFIDCGKVQGLGGGQPPILKSLKISPVNSQLSFPPEQLKSIQAEQKLSLTPLPTKTFGFKAIPLHQQICHRETLITDEGNKNFIFRQNPKILTSQRSTNIMGLSQQNFDESKIISCKQMNKKQSQKENLKIHYF